jgi:hypothetical protein
MVPIEIDLDDLEAGVPGLTFLWEREILAGTALRGFETEPALPDAGPIETGTELASEEREEP